MHNYIYRIQQAINSVLTRFISHFLFIIEMCFLFCKKYNMISETIFTPFIVFTTSLSNLESSVCICRWTLFVGICNYVRLYLLAIYMFRFRTKHWQETTCYSLPNICRSLECYLPYRYFWLVLTTVPWITLLYKAIATESSFISDFSNLTFTCIFFFQDLLECTLNLHICFLYLSIYIEWIAV